MDQAHDIAFYLEKGLKEFASSSGSLDYLIADGRDFAVCSGWAKDQPYTAVFFIGFPTQVDISIGGLKKIRERLLELQEDSLSNEKRRS